MKDSRPPVTAAAISRPSLGCAVTGKRSLFSRPGKTRVGLVPRIVGLVVIVAILTGGLISAVMVRQNQDILREQIIANNLASADLAAEFAYRYVEGVEISIRLLARRPSVAQAIANGDFSDATLELQEFWWIYKSDSR